MIGVCIVGVCVRVPGQKRKKEKVKHALQRGLRAFGISVTVYYNLMYMWQNLRVPFCFLDDYGFLGSLS